MERIALFPGSFDPFTRGHESVVRRALNLFDGIEIGIGINSSKKYLFSLEQRESFIREVFKGEPDRISVSSYSGLTVDYCKKKEIRFILRGLRNSRDYLFEYEIAGMNRALQGDIETVFLASAPEYSAINATVVREILKNKGDVRQFIPEGCSLPKIT